MAIQNDPRLYSAGTAVFDQQPHVALYANLMARKQARDQAFDDYIRNLNKSVNGAGVRNVDRPVFDKMVKEWQEFGMKNRDAIRQRRGGVDIAFGQKHQDLINLINESKTEEEKKKPLVDILLDPAKRDRVGDTVIDEVHSHDEPLYVMGEKGLERNPNRKSIDYSSVTFNPKPFEQDKYFKQFEDVKRMEMPPTVTTDPKTMTQTETKKSVYDQEAKDLIATRAVTDLAQNPSFRDVVKKLKPEDYNDFYKENYGHDIKNEADLAAAYTLKGLQQNVTTSKVNPDTFGRQKAMAGINDQLARRRMAIQNNYIKDRQKFNKASSKKEQQDVLEGYINRAFDEGKGTYTAVNIKGKWVPSRTFLVPQKMKDLYTIDKGKDWQEVPTFSITSDKKYVVPIYPGKKADYKAPIPIETFRNELGQLWLTKKDAAGEMDEIDFGDDTQEDEAPVSTSGGQPADDDSYTRSELKAAGWSDSQIDEAKKSGKIKVK